MARYLDDSKINIWLDNGKKELFKIMLVLFDLEDKDYFPVYFLSENELIKYQDNIVSESKLKIIKSFYI